MTIMVPLSEAELTAQKLRDMAAELIQQAEVLEYAYGISLDPERKKEFNIDHLFSKRKNKKKPN